VSLVEFHAWKGGWILSPALYIDKVIRILFELLMATSPYSMLSCWEPGQLVQATRLHGLQNSTTRQLQQNFSTTCKCVRCRRCVARSIDKKAAFLKAVQSRCQYNSSKCCCPLRIILLLLRRSTFLGSRAVADTLIKHCKQCRRCQ
jgi:hypothetical protein